MTTIHTHSRYKQFPKDLTIYQVISTSGRGSTSIPKASATTRISENKIAASTPYLRNGCMVTSSENHKDMAFSRRASV